MLLQAILLFFFAGIVSVILLLLQPINLKTYNLAVIGTVLDKETHQPIAHAHVVLEELEGKYQSTMTSHPDGGFWFTLQPTKKYRVLLVDANQQVIDEAHLSTMNTESKTFDVTLRATKSSQLAYLFAN
ncbi:MAG: carboxypeptidase-like regulatory domain-containing protein [Chitinophagales bacterium]